MRQTKLARDIVQATKSGEMERANDLLNLFIGRYGIHGRIGLRGDTLLHKAIRANSFELAQLLRSKTGSERPSLFVENHFRQEPFYLALRRGSRHKASFDLIYFIAREARDQYPHLHRRTIEGDVKARIEKAGRRFKEATGGGTTTT